MTNGSTSRRLVVAALAWGCVSLAVLWPTWRGALAQLGGYTGNSSFIGCSTDRSGNFVVVFEAGPDATNLANCADALNDSSLSGCSIEEQTQAINLSRGEFGTLFHIVCP